MKSQLNQLQSRLKRFFHFLLLHKSELIYFTLLFIILLTNALHEKYPDEFDNLLGGKYILHGKLLYKDFMSNHGPVAYFVAAIVQIFTGTSFVRFRLVYSLFLLVFFMFLIKFFKKRKVASNTSWKWYFLILALSSTYFWLHMLLADSLAAIFLILPYALIFYRLLDNRKLSKKDVDSISLFLFLALFTSLTYLYFIFFLYLLTFYLFFKDGFSVQKLRRLVLSFSAPYILYFVYLIITGSLKDYVYQNFTYNSKYYIFNAESSNGVNPLRYAITIAYKTAQTAIPAIQEVLKFNFYEPKTIALLGINVVALIYGIITGNIALMLGVINLILFTNARTNSIEIAETNYQNAPYITLSLASGFMLFSYLIKAKLEKHIRPIINFMLIYLIIAIGLFSLPITNSYMKKTYSKYMGFMPLIYDRPYASREINLILNKNDYVWIGPFAPESLYYLKEKTPSKYNWLLPGNAKAPKMRKGMMRDFNEHKPKIIIINTGYYIFGASPHEYNYFMMDFIHKHYTLISEIRNSKGEKYDCLIPNRKGEFDCNSHFFIRNDVSKEIVNKMLKLNLVRLL